MPSFDVQQAIADNKENIKKGTGMYMFGFEHHVSISLFDAGSWINLNGGSKICRLELESKNAISINLIFNDFYLEQGAYLHLYSSDKQQVQGAYTSANNNEDNVLGTDLIKGDKIIVEYYQPKNSKESSRLNIGMVVHGYIDINNWENKMKVNESGNCNMDVICPDGDLWRNEIKAVARIVNGGGLCSGTLVNNTNNDGKPYFLTANHCSPQSMASAVFRFNYDSPICGSQTASNSQTAVTNDLINGSSFKARNVNSDFGLILLNTVPPASYEVYYAGWNNSGDVPFSTVGIHHPRGDVKKISFDDNAPASGNMGSAIVNAEWNILAWDRNTTTEGGSSGSGLWDENHYIIGQLHGGQANCSNSINDYYGKFAVSWNGSSATNRLRDWLDPNNSGVTSLTGFDPNAPLNNVSLIRIESPLELTCGNTIYPSLIIKNIGEQNLEYLTFKYGIDNYSSTYIWTGDLQPNDTLLINLPSFSVHQFSEHNLMIKAINPNHLEDSDTLNNTLNKSFISNENCLAFPNPFSNNLTVNLELDKVNDKPIIVSITDALGKTLWKTEYKIDKGSQLNIKTNDLASGIYLLNIRYSDYLMTQKIVKK